jgi:hypothetical protein
LRTSRTGRERRREGRERGREGDGQRQRNVLDRERASKKKYGEGENVNREMTFVAVTVDNLPQLAVLHILAPPHNLIGVAGIFCK